MATEGGVSMKQEDFMGIAKKAKCHCSIIATGIVSNSREGQSSTAEKRIAEIKSFTNILIPLYMEKVLFVEEKQLKAQKLLQKLKLLRSDNEIYEPIMFFDGISRQKHTLKACAVLSMLCKELDIEGTDDDFDIQGSVVDVMDKFIESIEFALS